MTTISFKADDQLKHKLELLASKKGINTSAFIKLILTRGMQEEMSEVTENGLTIAEEMAILESDKNDRVSGPFTEVKSLMKALEK